MQKSEFVISTVPIKIKGKKKIQHKTNIKCNTYCNSQIAFTQRMSTELTTLICGTDDDENTDIVSVIDHANTFTKPFYVNGYKCFAVSPLSKSFCMINKWFTDNFKLQCINELLVRKPVEQCFRNDMQYLFSYDRFVCIFDCSVIDISTIDDAPMWTNASIIIIGTTTTKTEQTLQNLQSQINEMKKQLDTKLQECNNNIDTLRKRVTTIEASLNTNAERVRNKN